MRHTLLSFLEMLKTAGMVTDYNLCGCEDTNVEYLTYDSRAVVKDTLFICKGVAFKALYLENSIRDGACCYVSERKYDVEAPYILVKDIRQAMPLLAVKYYNNPAKNLNITGLTGTKGKSTTTYFIKAIIDDYMEATGGRESAMLSTIDVYDGVIREASHMTTPEAVELQKHFHNAVCSDIKYLTMEVSSQALKYNRVDEVEFDCGLFLNISEDHISSFEHSDFEDYFTSKLRIFAQTKTAIVNLNMDLADRAIDAAKASDKLITFGTEAVVTEADVFGYDIRKDGHSTLFRVRTKDFDREFRINIPGLFNVENALAAIAVACEYNIPLEYIESGLFRARSSGRMEIYPSKDNKITAIVDYAHNKLSFEKLFDSVSREYPGKKIVAVFGCTGDKAPDRRPAMGAIAGQYCAKAYLTADDPGTEAVADICAQIQESVSAQGCPSVIIEDRVEAIKTAFAEAASSDEDTILMIPGKGNDAYQIVGKAHVPYLTDGYYAKFFVDEYNKNH